MQKEQTNRKNICIVTWIGTENPGTNLQCFALQEYLCNCGYVVSIINSIPYAISGIAPSFSLGYYFRYGLSLFGIYQLWLSIKHRFIGTQLFKTESQHIQSWISHNIHLRKIFFKYQLRALESETDVFISGSDQIWNTCHGFNPTMFLSFVNRKRCISFASSIGGTQIDPKYQPQIRQLLLKYQKISVRETSSINVINSLLGRDDTQALVDPIFLLTKEEWQYYAMKSTRPLPKTKFLLVYLLHANGDYSGIIQEISSKLHLSNVLYISTDKSYVPPNACSDKILTKVKPFDFINALLHSAFICTDSFHGISFSINFKIPFVAIKPTKHPFNDTRVQDVLNLFKLTNRIYTTQTTNWTTDLPKALCLQVSNERQLAKNYLSTALSNIIAIESH